MGHSNGETAAESALLDEIIGLVGNPKRRLKGELRELGVLEGARRQDFQNANDALQKAVQRRKVAEDHRDALVSAYESVSGETIKDALHRRQLGLRRSR
jgi:hypothetical protein